MNQNTLLEDGFMDKKTLLYHIGNLIEFKVGEQVFVLEKYTSRAHVPMNGEIIGIRTDRHYHMKDDEEIEPYTISYKVKYLNHQNESQEDDFDAKHLRKWDEKISKVIADYYSFFAKLTT